MNDRLVLALPLLLLAPLSDAVGQAVTYDFEGSVTSASGIYSAVPEGATVTGTYTFDLADANNGFGTVGSYNWGVSGNGGTQIEPLHPFQGFVFTSTAAVDGFTYSSPRSPSFEGLSSVQALTDYLGPEYVSPIGESYFIGSLYVVEDSSSFSRSTFTLWSRNLTYTSSGLPIFETQSTGIPSNGEFDFRDGSTGSNGYVSYTLTSMNRVASAVPEPTTFAMSLFGISLFGLRRWHHRNRQSVG